MGAVDKCFGQVELAASFEILGERMQHAFERAVADPVLKSAMAGLIRRISRRQVLPRCACAQDPEHSHQHVAGIAVRPSSDADLHRLLGGKQRLQERPLIFGEIHLNL